MYSLNHMTGPSLVSAGMGEGAPETGRLKTFAGREGERRLGRKPDGSFVLGSCRSRRKIWIFLSLFTHLILIIAYRRLKVRKKYVIPSSVGVFFIALRCD